jgi:hypothetical protein
MQHLVLLGPQRFDPTVRDAFGALDVTGPIAVVTAGWQEREAEDADLRDHLGCELRDLLLYRRYEQVLEADRELALALRQRQERLREIQELYRVRLGFALDAARALMARRGGSGILLEQRRAAIRSVRALDREHLRRLRHVHDEFAARWRPIEREAVVLQRREIGEILAGCGGLAIAGGHVSVLLNRMRLFDLPELLAGRPVVAWSAGAMAVSERIVLFHDSPPQGPGNPEVLDLGLALGRGIVPLPHARRRLRLEDPVRVELFARRFAPATCVILEGAARLLWNGERWAAGGGTSMLGRGGRVRPIGAA